MRSFVRIMDKWIAYLCRDLKISKNHLWFCIQLEFCALFTFRLEDPIFNVVS